MDSSEESLEKLGLSAFEEIFLDAPEEALRLGVSNATPDSGFDVSRRLRELTDRSDVGADAPIFVGAGCYDHYVPIAIENMTNRADFYSAFRAKRPEGARTILSALVKYQERVAILTDADLVDVSVYCGGSPLARACLLASKTLERKVVLIPETLNSDQRQIVQIYADAGLLELRVVPEKNGLVDLAELERFLDEEGERVAAVVVQYPNFYGNLERVSQIVSLSQNAGALVVMSVELISLSMLKSPGEWGADLVVGDSLPHASPLNFNRPRLGFIATSKAFERRLPRRLLREVDASSDVSERSFLLRREDNSDDWKSKLAPSREILDATLALMFFAFISPEELQQAAKASHRAAKYARDQLAKAGFQFCHDAPFLREFAVKVDDPRGMNEYLRRWGVVGGFEIESGLLFAFTEKHSPEEVDELVFFMKTFQFGTGSGEDLTN